MAHPEVPAKRGLRGTCRRKLIEAMQQGDHALLESLAGSEKVEAGSLSTAGTRRPSVRRYGERSCGRCNALPARPGRLMPRNSLQCRISFGDVCPACRARNLASVRRSSSRQPRTGRWRVRRHPSNAEPGSFAESLSELDRESLGAPPHERPLPKHALLCSLSCC